MIRLIATISGLLLTAITYGQTLNIDPKVKFLALGDSYTIGQSVAVSERWPVQLIDSLRNRGLACEDVKIIAYTGWRTDNLKEAIQMANLKNEYNLVSLLIGVNNYYQGRTLEAYKPEFQELLQTAIALANGHKNRVFVVSIPDYGYTPFGQSNQATISAGIDQFNAANKKLTFDAGVAYFDITDISRKGLAQPELVASDGLHPSGKQYSMWVTRIMKGVTLNQDPIDTTEVITGVNEHTKPITIYPNPFTSQITIEGISPANDAISIKMLNTSGAVVFEEAASVANQNEFTIHPNLPGGLYLYQISNRTGTLSSGRIFRK